MNNIMYDRYRYQNLTNIDDNDKVAKFMERIAPFSEINNLEEAKALAQKILPTNNDITTFYIGEMKCIVVNRSNLLRISVISPQNVVCYSFS